MRLRVIEKRKKKTIRSQKKKQQSLVVLGEKSKMGVLGTQNSEAAARRALKECFHDLQPVTSAFCLLLDVCVELVLRNII